MPVIDKKLRYEIAEEIVQEEGGGFVTEFIFLKYSNYDEPVRKGTPKGEKIGLSKKKYLASILVGTTNWKLKKIAKSCDVSYGLLRKWKTEPDFRAEADRHCTEFVKEIVERIKTGFEKQHKNLHDYYEEVGDDPYEMKKDASLNAADRIMVDAHLFNNSVLNGLADAAFKLWILRGDNEIGFYYGLVSSLYNVITFGKTKDFLMPQFEFLKAVIDEIKEIITLEREPSSKERRIATANLNFIEIALKNLLHTK